MIQQINLYQQDDSSSHVLTNPYALTLLSACLLLVTLSIISLVSLHSKQDDQKLLQVQFSELQNHLQQLQAKYPKQQIDSALNVELEKTRTYYQNLSQILSLLADTKSDRTLGFSRYLTTLANQADNQVWLTDILINSETESITLKGSTFKPDQIPLLLQRLQNTPAFKGRHFARLSMEQSTVNPEQVDFNVSSSLKPDKEEADDRKH